ncbi:DUF2184 domain-containing protein [Oceaniglobus trochenteri]|uniref:DUF2184 domain-containing protein n=1 Tax=Oceaniglobus trochenteri TaxID=2763260 RepID=UPI001CFF69CC|nr:major capsid family protein [Oceaniglobus trochenteri]
MTMHTQFNDAMQASLGFAQKQTSHIEAGVYALRYPELNYAELVPVDTSAGEWAKSVTYYSMDGAGKAGWINGNGKDIPVVGASMNQHETAVYTAGIGYSYGYEEINQARLLGVALDSTKAGLARRAYEQMVYEIALNGDTTKGFEGLYAYTGVPAASVAADGTGSATAWSTKTPDQIIRDVNALLTGIVTTTKETELADTLILPTERFNYIASTRLTDTGLTILEFIQKANVYTAQTGQPLMIRGKRGLLTKGAGGTARMIAYRRSPEVLKLHLPMPHRFLPVQMEGLQFTIPGVFRLGGVDVRLPKAISYGDGL